MSKFIDQWLEIVKDARRLLKPAKYQEWCFIVGSSGSLGDRIELGEKALEMLKPKSGEVATFNFTRIDSSGITNAVSPLSGDYPMQRGVKKT